MGHSLLQLYGTDYVQDSANAASGADNFQTRHDEHNGLHIFHMDKAQSPCEMSGDY